MSVFYVKQQKMKTFSEKLSEKMRGSPGGDPGGIRGRAAGDRRAYRERLSGRDYRERLSGRDYIGNYITARIGDRGDGFYKRFWSGIGPE